MSTAQAQHIRHAMAAKKAADEAKESAEDEAAEDALTKKILGKYAKSSMKLSALKPTNKGGLTKILKGCSTMTLSEAMAD